jgi:hypothetical protein
MGCFCEFYGEQAERYGKFFGLSTVPKAFGNKAGMTKRRKGIEGAQCGFPVGYLKEFKKKAHHAGLPYVVVGERGFYPSGLKKRVITEIFRVIQKFEILKEEAL